MPTMYESPEKEIEALAAKARKSGCWFYSNITNDWLTPEEFENLAKTFLITEGQNNRTIINQYHSADPKIGIAARMRNVDNATGDLRQFTERVLNYFCLVSKDKKE